MKQPMLTLEWEQVNQAGYTVLPNCSLYQAVVPGGYLLATVTFDRDQSSTAVIFLPDPAMVARAVYDTPLGDAQLVGRSLK